MHLFSFSLSLPSSSSSSSYLSSTLLLSSIWDVVTKLSLSWFSSPSSSSSSCIYYFYFFPFFPPSCSVVYVRVYMFLCFFFDSFSNFSFSRSSSSKRRPSSCKSTKCLLLLYFFFFTTTTTTYTHSILFSILYVRIEPSQGSLIGSTLRLELAPNSYIYTFLPFPLSFDFTATILKIQICWLSRRIRGRLKFSRLAVRSFSLNYWLPFHVFFSPFSSLLSAYVCACCCCCCFFLPFSLSLLYTV